MLLLSATSSSATASANWLHVGGQDCIFRMISVLLSQHLMTWTFCCFTDVKSFWISSTAVTSSPRANPRFSTWLTDLISERTCCKSCTSMKSERKRCKKYQEWRIRSFWWSMHPSFAHTCSICACYWKYNGIGTCKACMEWGLLEHGLDMEYLIDWNKIHYLWVKKLSCRET